MNKKVKKLSAAALLVGSLLSAATLRGEENQLYSVSFSISGEFDEQGYPQAPSLENWNGCLTYFFIEGVDKNKNVSQDSSVKTIQGLLNKGDTTFVDYALCSSKVFDPTYGELPNSFSSGALLSDPSKLAPGEYTAFAVLFDAKSPTEIATESTKYLVLNNFVQTQEPYTLNGETKIDGVGDYKGESKVVYTKYTFTDNSAGKKAANAGNWGTFGVVPEPTSGVMLLLGVAALALKRKRG